MTLAQTIALVLKASIAATVFALGLGVAHGDLRRLFRQPGLLARSLVSMFVVMLVTSVVVAKIADLRRPVEIVLVCLALAPIPPLLPNKQTKAGGEASYTYGLIVAASLFALVWIPLMVEVLSRASGQDLSAPVPEILILVGAMILAPLAAGALFRRYATQLAARIQAPISRLASLVLLVGLALIFIKSWRPMLAQLGDGTLAALIGFVLVGLVVGHLLGGPNREDRTALALASACRHPGIALSIASLNFPQEKSVLAVILLYLIVSALLTVPYVSWRGRQGRGVISASAAH
jgi:bile acid:Na+ symporter, BASS family